MAAHSAIVTNEEDETVIRIQGHVRLPLGPVLVREVEETGEVILAPVVETSHPNPWFELFDSLDRQPRDEHWDEFSKVMRERPINRLPVERNLFGKE
jgi:hypothetical protein